MLSKIHITKRLHTPMSLAEQAKVESHFIDYCAIHNIDVTTYTANKRTVRAFVYHLANLYSDFEGITDWDTAYKTNFFRSLSQKVGNMTGIRCKVIKGKVAVRKMELDRQESSSDESEEIEEKQAKANPKRESRAPNPSPSKSPKVEAKTEADLANLNSIQNSTAADSIHVKDAPEQVKLHSKDQIQFTTAAAELWANTEKLQLKKRELKALKKEREALMKLLKPALDDPLADD